MVRALACGYHRGFKSREEFARNPVANLWPNRLIGDASLPWERRLTWTMAKPYSADAPLVLSCLLGPVTIQMSPTSRPKGHNFTLSLYPGSTHCGR